MGSTQFFVKGAMNRMVANGIGRVIPVANDEGSNKLGV